MNNQIHPCKGCEKRKLNCRKGCYNFLEYSIFHSKTKINKTYTYRASESARKSGIRQKQIDDNKRKHDQMYYFKYVRGLGQ